MPVANSYSFLVGPLVACGALLVLVLLCRWVFSTADRDARTARRRAAAAAAASGDFGLLVPVAQVRTVDDAELLRGVLREAGIRATVARGQEATEVLVFRADALRARELVAS